MLLRPGLAKKIFFKSPHLAGCTTYMDIVIVLDGSNSIYPWYEVQNFLSNILSKFHISSDQMQVIFALLKYTVYIRSVMESDKNIATP